MGRSCSICIHPQRIDIECDILNNMPFRAISKQYSVGRGPVQRHFDNGHIGQETIKAEKLRKIAYSEDLLDKLLFLQHESFKILDEAKNPKEGNPMLTVALSAIGKAAGMLETQAKLAGQLKELEINIAVNPAWIAIKEQIFLALKTFPDARKAMLEAVSGDKLTDLQRKMIEPEPGFADVTPGVMAIINQEFGGEPLETKPDPNQPGFKKSEKPKPAPGQRIRYRCIKAHSQGGRMWEVGQVWDSQSPDGPEPPAASKYWELYNPAEKKKGLRPTRRYDT